MNEILIPNARLYAARHELELVEPLGSGKDGIVWVAKRKAKQEQFEGRWAQVQEIMDAFKELGIYLLDVSPGNIGFVHPT